MNHASISDPYLHEPKGISTAEENTVYYANGSGSGTWGKLPIPALNFTVTAVPDYTFTDAEAGKDIVYNGLITADTSQIVDLSVNSGIASEDLGKLNQNQYNMFQILDNHSSILETFRTDIESISNTVKELRQALINIGLISGG